jgi:deoxycytidylate deaminase
MPKGFEYISLSKILKDLYCEEFPKKTPHRQELQKYGNKVREEKGLSFLAEKAIEIIKANPEKNRWVIDSIKNPNEIKSFREREYSSNFYLIGVFADYNVRWLRKKDIYKGNETDFAADDKRDNNEDIPHGQHVRDCFLVSDLVFLNNKRSPDESREFYNFDGKIQDFLRLIDNPLSRAPSEEEALMAIAYANSLRSSCLKRKVGAVIVDNRGVILSSGCNEVPLGEDPCKGAHGRCYRDFKKAEFSRTIDEVVQDEELNTAVKNVVLKKYKMLEMCRALHAEENAIINIARFGSQVNLKEATLYTTTYPCNLCANKISQVGIGKIVYLEPYPQEEAKILLDSRKIEQKPFEGVAYKGYFRLFGGEIL